MWCATIAITSLTVSPIPRVLPVGLPELHAPGYWDGHMALVSRQRMRHVGHDRYRRSVIYGSVAPDGRLYLAGADPAMLHLREARLSAIFEDPAEADAWACGGAPPCDPLDAPLRAEEAHVPLIIQSVVRELSMAAYRPQDPANDSADALSAGGGPRQGGGAAEEGEEAEP